MVSNTLTGSSLELKFDLLQLKRIDDLIAMKLSFKRAFKAYEEAFQARTAEIKKNQRKRTSRNRKKTLFDLDYDYEEPEKHDDSVNTPSYVSDDDKKKLELETRLTEIREFLMENQGVPERKISEDNPLRPQERYSVRSFCLKGRHHSDSCPTYVSVKSRMKRACCKLCMDSRRNTEHCRNEIRQCMYCRSEKHNKALCTLPEEIQEAYKKVEEIEHELDNLTTTTCTT
ncbi:hypothetical protein V3C99_012996 [Haemonchus contortus]|uniref:Uncharacterized protein n=1 Tax=Haemonchus contortus TaxID=6289 RepID=A0A7I4Y2J1_HAECO